MASLSLDVQQYSSGIEHYVIESKMRALLAVGRGGLRTHWLYSIVDLAHLAVVTMFPTSACQDTLERSPWVAYILNSPAFDVLLVNSEQAVNPSRHS